VLRLPTLGEVLATRVRTTFPYRINFNKIDYHNLQPMKDWLSKNCKGIYRFELVHAIYVQFVEEQDALMFMLKWGTAEGNDLKRD
jgi:hypothetical protein